MELREWQYMNKPAGSTTNNSSSSGYKKRFEKLIKYHIDHASSELESVTTKDIKPYGFHLGEHYNTGSSEFDRTIIVSVNKYTDEFYLSIFVDGKVVYQNDYEGYEKVLEILTGSYMFLPDEGTQDYDDLLSESLNEWKYANPPASSSQPASVTSSKTNKEKFTELVAYMQKHKDSSVIFTSVNGPNDTGFEYEEQRAFADGSEYNLSVEVSLGKHDLFTIHIDTDGKRKYNIMAKGWEELLSYLRIYFHAPKTGSPEYKSLTESFSSELNEWKYMNPPQPATSKNPYTRGQAYRYNRLLDQITSDGIVKYKLNKLTNDTLDITVDTKKQSNLNVKIIYNPITNDYSFTVGGRTLPGCDYEEDILELLNIAGVIKNTNLCESAGSMADDFKLYENLWEDVDVEEYNMVLGRTQYNLYNDSDLNAYLTQSARLMRKPIGNEKPLEFFKLQKVNKMLRTPKYGNEKKLAAKLQKVKAELKKSLN
jgi:hypothetical protein